MIEDNLPTSLPSTELTKPANYVFVGEAQLLDSTASQAILDFVEAGNQAFFSTRLFPPELLAELYSNMCPELEEDWWGYSDFWDMQLKVNLSHPELQMPDDITLYHIRRRDTTVYAWQYFELDYMCEGDTAPVILGYGNDSLINFVRFDYGKGSFYIHSMPLAFANISLLDKAGVDYAGRVFTHLAEGPIYWDNATRTTLAIAERSNANYIPEYYRGLSEENPMRYMLAQPALAWAWYIGLAMGLLYLLFRAKRQQRIIPVLETNTNTSLAFIRTIGSLYFLQNSHKKLALQKMKFFLGDVREQFRIQTKQLDAAFATELATRAEVSEELINRILLYYNNINSSKFVSENTLMEFHQLLEQFWKGKRNL